MKIAQVELPSLHFVGRVFTGRQMTSARSFQTANLASEQDPHLQALVEKLGSQERANLIVFGPDNFAYWYGILTKGKLPKQPGLLAYDLPPAQAAQTTRAGNLAAFSLPLNQVLPLFLDQVRAAGIRVAANLGNSETPFVLRTIDLREKKITTRVYLAAKAE